MNSGLGSNGCSAKRNYTLTGGNSFSNSHVATHSIQNWLLASLYLVSIVFVFFIYQPFIVLTLVLRHPHCVCVWVFVELLLQCYSSNYSNLSIWWFLQFSPYPMLLGVFGVTDCLGLTITKKISTSGNYYLGAPLCETIVYFNVIILYWNYI